MKFTRISVTKKGVELDFENRNDDATEDVKWSSHHPPLGSFKDAMQGLTSYVVDLIPFLSAVRESLTVTTVNLSEDKNGLRGLIVTATTPVEKAYGKPLVLNTPLVREGGELPLDDAFVLSDEVLELITLIESEARRYKNGEHSEPEMAATSENTTNASERMAAAEVASTRKPRGKGKGKLPKDAHPVLSEALRQELLQVERDIPADVIALWSDDERETAHEWAMARLEEMLGQRACETMPTEPAHVIAAATLPLKADDEWSESPVRVSEDGAQAIAAAVEGAR